MANIFDIARAHLEDASHTERGVSSELVIHDGHLRQSILTLRADAQLAEHNSPPSATLQVLVGRIIITAPSGDVELAAGELHQLTKERHGVHALEDSAFLLTTVTSVSE